MPDPKPELEPDQIKWIEEPEIEEAVAKAEEGLTPQGYEEGRPSSEHEDEGWRAARLSKP